MSYISKVPFIKLIFKRIALKKSQSSLFIGYKMKVLTLIVGVLIAFATSHSLPTEDGDGTVVNIETGPIRGHILKSQDGKDYWAFQEIPYAAPPVGPNRYQMPKPPNSWDQELDATNNTKICYQGTKGYPAVTTEDCLYINVYTPVKPQSGKKLPVLIWIHGGGFVGGSGIFEEYSPMFFMDYDIVVVAFNYRLGAFGFLATEDGVIPPNLGIEDQKFAIKWVNRNIHLFGGDKQKITIAGESAGSMAVGTHLLGPWEDEPLFQAAIMQSGSPLGSMDSAKTNSTVIAIDLAHKLNPDFNPKDTKDLLKFLQSVEADDILRVGIAESSYAKPENLVYQHFKDGNYKKVPVLMGFNSEEFLATNASKQVLAALDKNSTSLVSPNINMSWQNRQKAGAMFKDIYVKGGLFVNHPGGYIRHLSDMGCTTPMCKQAELCSTTVPYYLYQLSYKGPLGNHMNIQGYDGTGSVVHSEDLCYMWDYAGYNRDLSKYPESDKLTMKRVLKMWTNFVKYHNPTPEDDPLLNVKWLPTEPRTMRYLNINATLELKENPRQYMEVRKILDAYIEPPYTFYQ